MDLKPSHMFYSQDSINNFFDKRSSHNRTKLGETLDSICEGRCHVLSIPTITVVKLDGKWVTADNRRLWIFHQLERLGKCDTIPVRISPYIPAAKLTSNNGGTSVCVRGPAGGYWHNAPTPPTGFAYTSVPTRMTTALKSNVEHPSPLTDSLQTNPIRSRLHSTYKAQVPATPIRYPLSKWPTFSDISKAHDDHSH
ncbi:hypothetical protein DPMN_100831 [Dreissena polymorpha]|uniref:Uncharacterized protein n=1 Tax=Dreissena polymorpha TaxID=45954 RepID=A0A9D4R913_DREPO|nr:hypothetical protein DPMN_100831 [Dreissena polymorpha]